MTPGKLAGYVRLALLLIADTMITPALINSKIFAANSLSSFGYTDPILKCTNLQARNLQKSNAAKRLSVLHVKLLDR